VLLPGQRHDLAGVKPLIETVDFDMFLADKAFDADWGALAGNAALQAPARPRSLSATASHLECSLSHGLQLTRLGAFGKPGAVQGRDGHRFTRLETRRSNSSATMMIVPIAVPCQKGDTPMRFSPLRIITVMNTPISVPTMEPRPP